MQVDMNGIQLKPPPGFLPEETSASFRVAGEPGLKDPRAMQTMAPIRPNLVVQRKRMNGGSKLVEHVAKMCADLIRHVPDISTIDSDSISFDDDTEGMLLKYTLPGFKDIRLLQLQAVRLDDDVLTSLLITAGTSDIAEEALEGYYASLRSVSISDASPSTNDSTKESN